METKSFFVLCSKDGKFRKIKVKTKNRYTTKLCYGPCTKFIKLYSENVSYQKKKETKKYKYNKKENA